MMIDWLANNIEPKRSWFKFVLFTPKEGFNYVPFLKKNEINQLVDNAVLVLKADKGTTVVGHQDNKKNVVIKRYNAKSLKHLFTRAVRRSRAQRCWTMSYEFAKVGLNVAQPYLMFEQRFGPLRLDAYFVSEILQGKELLSAFPQMLEQEKTSVVEQVHDAFTKMQKAKITHGDMKATNLMWVDEQLYFIDLDAAQAHHSSASFKRANAKDKKRFLKNWKDQPELLALFSKLP